MRNKLNKYLRRLGSATRSPAFARNYAFAALAVLLTTTLFWTILSGFLQLSNADQLADPYLFGSSSILHGAAFPASHTFLIKWPLFYLVNILGSGAFAYIFVTVICVLGTVGALAYLLYKIDNRPLRFGTYCLALASILLMVPPVPYAGAILPVNMAMIATRNLEYVAYIAALALMIKSSGLRDRIFWLGCGLLGLLIASDKLFLSLSILSALLALIAYASHKTWRAISPSVNWLIGSFIATGLAALATWFIAASKVARLVDQSAAGPYQLVHDMHHLALGTIYGILGLLTNFGANPAFHTTIVRKLPHDFFGGFGGIGGPAYLVNLVIFGGLLFCAWKIVRVSLAAPNSNSTPTAHKLSLALVWSTLVSLIAFIITDHYYAVDSRYLGISLFGLTAAGALFLRSRNVQTNRGAGLALVLILGVIFGTVANVNNFSKDRNALAEINKRNKIVAQALKHHKVSTLVGDYWRVLPIRFVSDDKLNVTPLVGCTQPRDNLISTANQPSLNNHSFAYILSLDIRLTDFPSCSLDNVTKIYGRPNSSAVIAGSQTNPTELLLFYDRGIQKHAASSLSKIPSTVLPVPLDQVPYTSCPNGTTIMNIVAHQDDDLLFMNPDTDKALKEGHCIRTIYITAGDGGGDQFYWLSREQGSESAYSQMVGVNKLWVKRIVQLGPNQYVQVSHPMQDYQVSLIFMRLPDGNTTGSGFRAYLYESLARMELGKVSAMQTVDNQSSYTPTQLVQALAQLMRLYQPSEIRTMANFVSKQYADHSDHMAVGRLVKKAYAAYETEQFENSVQVPIHYYLGYPVHGLPENVSGPELAAKNAAWYAYARFDGGVCHNDLECAKQSVYGIYLKRQYQNAY